MSYKLNLLVAAAVATWSMSGIAADTIKIGVELFEGLAKTFGPRRPDVGRHGIRQRMAGRKVTPDVPELLEIMRLRALGDLGPERGIAARAALAWDQVAALLRLG